VNYYFYVSEHAIYMRTQPRVLPKTYNIAPKLISPCSNPPKQLFPSTNHAPQTNGLDKKKHCAVVMRQIQPTTTNPIEKKKKNRFFLWRIHYFFSFKFLTFKPRSNTFCLIASSVFTMILENSSNPLPSSTRCFSGGT
jgi:hypothetical protein